MVFHKKKNKKKQKKANQWVLIGNPVDARIHCVKQVVKKIG